ncbi:hypothetical protein SMC26_23185 [Actinomadura fulvescens]|uniref:Uncharacterized protein n=1 Tax=Actinomadura fulvescens TaxID=46160 RepID=A0ABP6DCG8_9ACTN
MSLLPPQPPPVRRDLMIAPHTTISLQPRTPTHLSRARDRLLFNANINDPAAYNPPTYEQAKLSAR